MVENVVVDRESLLVELVDETGVTIGSCPVSRAHHPPGQPHRAFSVLLFDTAGRVLLQRRAAVKTRFPSRWSNACCGHRHRNKPSRRGRGSASWTSSACGSR
nr:NUDIX domain-containing protein [Nocardia tengchongensis]